MVSRRNLPIINIDELIPEEAATADGIQITTRIASNNVEAGRLRLSLSLLRFRKAPMLRLSRAIQAPSAAEIG